MSPYVNNILFDTIAVRIKTKKDSILLKPYSYTGFGTTLGQHGDLRQHLIPPVTAMATLKTTEFPFRVTSV
jgi:hypothetical protein